MQPNYASLNERRFGALRSGTLALQEWAIVFLVISLIAGVFGFSGVSAATSRIAKIPFFIAITIFVIFVLLTIFAAIF